MSTRERKEFEAWAADFYASVPARRSGAAWAGEYRGQKMQGAWVGWLARANLPTLVPPGWRFYSADFSRHARDVSEPGCVMLERDEAGRTWWHRQPINDAVAPAPSLYVVGHGFTFDEALRTACEVALASETPA